MLNAKKDVKDVKLLQLEEEAVNCSADKAVEDSEEIFTELIRLLEKRSSDVEQQIGSQSLSHTEDHNQFLHIYPSLTLSESTHSSSIRIRPLRYFEDVTAAVSQVKGRLQDILIEAKTTMLQIVSQVDVLLPQPEPKTRADFLKYSQEITLDPNTADEQLLLSEGNRKVTYFGEGQYVPLYPYGYLIWRLVLSREILAGRCYFVVERTAGVDVAVTYANIDSAGWLDKIGFGYDHESWSLYREGFGNMHVYIYYIDASGSKGRTSRIGVYLDQSAGVVSFYGVTDTMTLIHSCQSTFTQPLCAGLGFDRLAGRAEFCKLK